MITLFIERDLITEDYHKEKKLIRALSSFYRLPVKIHVFIITNHNTTDDFQWLKRYFNFRLYDGSFAELLESEQNITKDKVFLSHDVDDLIKWDSKRGKSILVKKNLFPSDFDQSFNKLLPTYTIKEIRKKLRMYIHV